MSRSRQTPESIRLNFDRIAPLSNDGWKHNAHYHEYLMERIPQRCTRVLEIGCGTGRFSRLVAARAGKVLAIGLSPQIIRLARERSRLHTTIDFVEADAMSYHLLAGQFDCVAT